MVARVTRSPAEPTTRPPTNRTGASTAMPQRMPNELAMSPTTGNVSRPASTNTEARANPVDRARGGSTSDRVANRPGTTTARPALTTTLALIATAVTGAAANTAAATDTASRA